MKNILCLAVAGLALGASAVDMQTVGIYGYRFEGEDTIYTSEADIGKYFTPSDTQVVFGENHSAYRFASDSRKTFRATLADYKILKVIDWRVAYDFEYINVDNFRLAQSGGDEFVWTIDDGGDWVRILVTLGYKKFHLSYNLDGGSGTFPETRDIAYNKVFNLPEHTPTRAGYTFGGWTNSVNTLFSPNEKVSGITLGVPEGADDVYTVLYAMWEKNEPQAGSQTRDEYYIMLDPNVADGYMPVVTARVDQVRTLPTNCYSRVYGNGWNFDGWKDSNGNIWGDGANVQNLAKRGETVVLYAQWARRVPAPYPDNEFSRALGCPELDWKVEGDNSGKNTWTSLVDTACLEMADLGNPPPPLEATLPSAGRIEFAWRAHNYTPPSTGAKDYLKVTIYSGNEIETNYHFDVSEEMSDFGNVGIDIANANRTISFTYKLNSGAGISDHPAKLEISNVVWTAEEDAYGMWGVRFDANCDDAKGMMMPVNTNSLSKLQFPLCAFERTGYEFLGWAKEAGADEQIFANGATVSVDEIGIASNRWASAEMYAVWKYIHAHVVITAAFDRVTYDGQMYRAPAEFTAHSDNPDYDVSKVRLVKAAEVKDKIYPGVYPRRLTAADFENTDESWNGRVFFEVVDGYLEIVENGSGGGDDSGGGDSGGDSGGGQVTPGGGEIQSDIEVGSTIAWSIPVPDGAKVKLSGLPTGLKYKNGLVTGVPTKSGTFTVKVKTKIGKTTTVKQFTIKVAAMPKYLVGAYYGFATNVDGVDALASFKLTNKAKLSGSFYDGYQKLSVSGKGFSGRTEGGAYLMDVVCKKGSVKYPATFEFSKTSAGGRDYWSVRAVVPSLVQIIAYRDMIPDLLGSVPAAYVGTTADYWPGLKVKVTKKGAVTVSGKIASPSGDTVSVKNKPHLVLLPDGTLWCRVAICKKSKSGLPAVFAEDLEFP